MKQCRPLNIIWVYYTILPKHSHSQVEYMNSAFVTWCCQPLDIWRQRYTVDFSPIHPSSYLIWERKWIIEHEKGKLIKKIKLRSTNEKKFHIHSFVENPRICYKIVLVRRLPKVSKKIIIFNMHVRMTRKLGCATKNNHKNKSV